jgi:hypothetical protein
MRRDIGPSTLAMLASVVAMSKISKEDLRELGEPAPQSKPPQPEPKKWRQTAMINFRPLQIQHSTLGHASGAWHYCAVAENGAVYPVGYCEQEGICPVCDGQSNPHVWAVARSLEGEDIDVSKIAHFPMCNPCNNRGMMRVPKPCQGHETKEEAEIHFVEWMTDRAMLHQKIYKYHVQCHDCGRPTLFGATGPIDMKIPLCGKHKGRAFAFEAIRQIVRRASGDTNIEIVPGYNPVVKDGHVSEDMLKVICNLQKPERATAKVGA